MPQAATLKKQHDIPQTALDMGDARLLVLPNGHMGHMGKKACKALGVTPKTAKEKHARDLFHFASSEDALSTPSFSIAERNSVDTWVKSIRTGTHKLLNTKGEEVIFQFDRIASQDSSFLVVSLIGADSKYEDKNDATLDQWIEQTLIGDKPTSKAKSKTPQVSKKTKKATSSASNSSQTLMNLSHDIMMSCERDGAIINVNKQFSSILGYTKAQQKKLSFTDIVFSQDRAQVRPILRHITDEDLPANQVVDFEARVVSRKGKIYTMSWRLTADDNILYLSGQDLSEVQEQQQMVQSQKSLLAEAQSIGQMGHWTWFMDSHHIEWSDEIYRIFGVDQASFNPSIETLTRYLNRRDVGRTMQAFQRAMIEKRDYEMEFAIKRPSGEERFIKCQGRCKKDSEGEVVSLFGIMQDVTDQIEHEHELRSAKESVERAYSAKSQFLANMSHELRTPLNAIIGFSEMMQRQLLGPIGTEKYLDYIKGIRESGEHLLDLISDILDMSKMEAGKYELVREDVNVNKLIKLCVHMMEGRALDGSLKLTTQLPKDDVSAQLDRRAIMQVLLNLLSNAVKFTKQNGHIEVSCRQEGGQLILAVSDDGIGIPVMKLNTITNPFEQVSNQYTRDHDGSGLGLAITKELVELHGGKMAIESVVDSGTTVTLSIPCSS